MTRVIQGQSTSTCETKIQRVIVHSIHHAL